MKNTQDRPKLCFVITDLAYGGAEVQLVRLAIALKDRGWKTCVVSMLSPQAFITELETQGVHVYSLDMQRGIPDPRALWKLARIIREFNPQVVHSHMIHANLVARLARVLAYAPVLISTIHSTLETGRSFRSEKIVHWAYRLTDPLSDITAHVAKQGYDRFLQEGVVSKRKLLYMPNGVDTGRFAPRPEDRQAKRREMGINNSEFVWLAVGRIEAPKDYPTMLYAFQKVCLNRPEARLVVVGKGELESQIRELTVELGLQSCVRFLGLRTDIPELLNAADAYVMSSAWEGMPMVLLEAHASGLPVVATDVGANRDVVQEGVSGFLVPARNPDALAAAMLRMMELPEEERRQMGLAGRQWVEDNYSLERIVDRWESLYFKLLSAKRVKSHG